MNRHTGVWGVACMAGLAGCAGAPVVPVPAAPVTVTVTRYVPVPAALRRPCAAPTPAASIASNGALLDAWLHDRAALQACGAQVRALDHLQRGANHD